jgi:hypothetical protein
VKVLTTTVYTTAGVEDVDSSKGCPLCCVCGCIVRWPSKKRIGDRQSSFLESGVMKYEEMKGLQPPLNRIVRTPLYSASTPRSNLPLSQLTEDVLLLFEITWWS